MIRDHEWFVPKGARTQHYILPTSRYYGTAACGYLADLQHAKRQDRPRCVACLSADSKHGDR